MRKSMVSLSQILNPKLLLRLSQSECSIHQETRSGDACMLVSVYKCMSRGFSCKHRLLPPPLNPSSLGDRKIKNDQTQNWFLISFQSPGGAGCHFYPVGALCLIQRFSWVLKNECFAFVHVHHERKTGDVRGEAHSSAEVCARVQLMQMEWLQLDFLWAKEGYLCDQHVDRKYWHIDMSTDN